MDHLTKEDEKDLQAFTVRCVGNRLRELGYDTRTTGELERELDQLYTSRARLVRDGATELSAFDAEIRDTKAELVRREQLLSHRRDVSCQRTECWQNEVCWKPGECDANNKANEQ